MEENYGLRGILETMKKNFTSEKFRPKSSQGTRILLLKHTSVVLRRDYWTLIFLLKDLIT